MAAIRKTDILAIEQAELRFASESLSAPDVGARAFKESMARLAFSIAVITSRCAEGSIGRTVTSFMPLSADPARIMVSIDSGSRLAAVIQYNGTFSMSLLAAGQEAVGDAFAGKVPSASRFAVGAWDRWPSENPKLRGAALLLDCLVTGYVDAGEHHLFLGSVIGEEWSAECTPLVWNDRRYRTLSPEVAGSKVCKPGSGGRD